VATFSLPGISSEQFAGNMGGIAYAFLVDVATLAATEPARLQVLGSNSSLGRRALQGAPSCPGSLAPGSAPRTSVTLAASLTPAQAAGLQLLFYQGGLLAPAGAFSATSALLRSCVGLSGFSAASAVAGGSAPRLIALEPSELQASSDSSYLAALILVPAAALALVVVCQKQRAGLLCKKQRAGAELFKSSSEVEEAQVKSFQQHGSASV
jgi:hypothetical protein